MSKAVSVGLMAAALALAGCVTDPETGEQRLSGGGGGALIGASGGAVLGALVGGGDGALIGAGIGGAAGGVIGNDAERTRRDREARGRFDYQRELAFANDEIDDALERELPAGVGFDAGSARLRPGYRARLDALAAALVANPPARIELLGHSDGDETAAQALATDRARTIADYLNLRGVAPPRIRLRGLGNRYPLASDDNETGRARNRRVELRVVTDEFASQAPMRR